MKLELFIFAITAFFIYNAYHDGKYSKILFSYKKYFVMGFFALLGLSLYLMIKKNPTRCKNILFHANNVVKYMPIDKSSMDMLSPILDFTNGGSNSFMENANNSSYMQSGSGQNYEKRLLQSGMVGGGGQKATKRSVSETKKKYVASIQDWKCGECKQKLTAWFEVDHKVRLEHGGSNEVVNLVALCRDCHGRKTAFENM
jgi:hypothetical protein